MLTIQAEVDSKNEEIKAKQAKLHKADEDYAKAEKVLQETQVRERGWEGERKEFITFIPQKKFENSVKQNEALEVMLEKKKKEYDQEVNRNEELAKQNSEQIAEIKIRVIIIIIIRCWSVIICTCTGRLH